MERMSSMGKLGGGESEQGRGLSADVAGVGRALR